MNFDGLYVLPNTDLPIVSKPGFCTTCKKFTAVEDLRTSSSEDNESNSVRLQMLMNRQTPPKCLSCGSIEIIVGSKCEQSVQQSDIQALLKSLPCPFCKNGTLYLQQTSTWYTVRLKPRYFSSEGFELVDFDAKITQNSKV